VHFPWELKISDVKDLGLSLARESARKKKGQLREELPLPVPRGGTGRKLPDLD